MLGAHDFSWAERRMVQRDCVIVTRLEISNTSSYTFDAALQI